jgi:hypothetical protein
MASRVYPLTGAEFPFGPLDLTILPSTSTPSEVILADAFIAFSPTCLQSTTTLAKVLLTTTCSWVKIKMF